MRPPGGGSGRPPVAQATGGGGLFGWLKRLFGGAAAPSGRTSHGMTAEETRAIEEFGRDLGIHFNDPRLLCLALTHRSYLHVGRGSAKESNERLEFLGDSVLGLITSEFLYKTNPHEHEGQLTKTKSLLVSKAILSRRALAIGLGKFVLMSNAEIESGGRQRLSILADAFESVLGAVYLDQGLEAARKFVDRSLLSEATDIVKDKQHMNYKSLLQEYVQSAFHTHPVYAIRHEHGPDHSKLFTVEVKVGGRTLGAGKGKNKKEAEQSAAHDALDRVAAEAGEKHRERRGEVSVAAAEEGERPRRFERPERGERRERRERPERAEGGERGERGLRGERPPRGERPERMERAERAERMERAERPERGERAERMERPERGERPERMERAERPERMERPERAERPERMERAERPERPERPRGFDRAGGARGPRPEVAREAPAAPRPERPAFAPRENEPTEPFAPAASVSESPTAAPEPAPVEPAAPPSRAESRPAARAEGERPRVDLSKAALVWESPTTPPARPQGGEGRFGRQPALKTGRAAGYTPPSVDPTRRPVVSEAPASAPRTTPEAQEAPRGPASPPPRVEAEVHEVKALPGVDASRYRAAEAPASRFSSDSPTAWDEEPKEHE